MSLRAAFVSEAIEPDIDSMDPARVARGEPDAPRAFSWRGARYEAVHVIRTWRTYKTDRGERYVDRHWFELRLRAGETARIYCLRRPRSTERWFLFSLA